MRVRQFLVWVAVAISTVLAASSGASAQTCTVTIDTMAFGSARLANLATAIAPATMRASCTGLTQVIRICAGVTSGYVTHTRSTSSQLKLNLFSDSQATIPLASGMDVAFDANGNGTASQTVYGRMNFAGGSFKAGDYQAVIQLGLTMTDLGSGPPCATPTSAAARTGSAVKTLLRPTLNRR